MQVYSDAAYSVFDVSHNNEVRLPPNSEYMVKNLGTESEMYNFSIPYQNGYYYARLSHLSAPNNVRAGVVLLSPQLASDSTSPVISLSDVIRVPVYAEKSYKIADIVTELSGYELKIDEDASVDANKNDVYDDDFDEARNNVTITENDIIFHDFKTPQNREMVLQVRDEFGNISKFPLTVEVYTPIPNIEAVSSDGFLSGKLNEILPKEPVDIFRIRTSEVPNIINSGSLMTNVDGVFASGSYKQSENIIAKSASDSFQIKKTGFFENLPAGYEVRVTPATLKNPLTISVLNVQKEVVYEQFLTLPSTARILENTPENMSATGNLLVTPGLNYSFVSALHTDPRIPGGAYITDKKFSPELAVAHDGNIYALGQNIALNVDEKDGYLRITALRGNEKIAEFLYKLDFFYTTK